jgi:arylsulfatase A-like enzyme
MRFSNFHCASAQCQPVRHELYTALLPPASGVYGNGDKPGGTFKNVSTWLGDLGYAVGLAGKVHFSTKYPLGHIPGFTPNCNSPAPTWDMGGVKEFIGKANAQNQNFCVFICSVNAHHPWTVGEPAHFPVDKVTLPLHMVDTPKTREAISRHAAEVEVLDEQVGATMRLLKEMSLEENTVLIFLSEQGMAMPQGKWSIYDYGTRALCLVRWPGQVAAGVTTPAVVQYCDIVPTLIDIAGGKQPAGIDGRSLLKVWKGETNEHRKYAFLVHEQYQRAICGDRFKLVWTPSGIDYSSPVTKMHKGKLYSVAWNEWLEKAKSTPSAAQQVARVLKHPQYELYDTQADPYELVNLADDPKYAEMLKQMTADLKAEIAARKDSMNKRQNMGGKGDDDE